MHSPILGFRTYLSIFSDHVTMDLSEDLSEVKKNMDFQQTMSLGLLPIWIILTVLQEKTLGWMLISVV